MSAPVSAVGQDQVVAEGEVVGGVGARQVYARAAVAVDDAVGQRVVGAVHSTRDAKSASPAGQNQTFDGHVARAVELENQARRNCHGSVPPGRWRNNGSRPGSASARSHKTPPPESVRRNNNMDIRHWLPAGLWRGWCSSARKGFPMPIATPFRYRIVAPVLETVMTRCCHWPYSNAPPRTKEPWLSARIRLLVKTCLGQRNLVAASIADIEDAFRLRWWRRD